MKNKTNKTTIPSCGCSSCQCHRELRCTCHDYNALLALALLDHGKRLRGQRGR